MGILKWAALCAAAAVLVGVKWHGYPPFSTDPAQVENTRYLVDRYKREPTQTASLIRRHTSACLSERIGKETSVELENFFGEVMVYTVRHADRDSRAFVSGYRALAEREGPAIDAKIAFLPKAEKQRVAALAEDLADGPHAMVGCVAKKLKVTG
jgi:hypothetical protein